MKARFSFYSNILFILLGFLSVGLHSETRCEIITPESNFGFKPGSDGMLFTYEELIDYLQKVDASSPRLKMV